mgnify:FL=1
MKTRTALISLVLFGLAAVDAIVKYFEAHPSLDPRIMSLRFKDKDTIQITTGVMRGPLDGGGSFYVARRENGRWIVRSSGVWVS